MTTFFRQSISRRLSQGPDGNLVSFIEDALITISLRSLGMFIQALHDGSARSSSDPSELQRLDMSASCFIR
jgi:hypothetical protein